MANSLSFDAWGERRDATTQISYRATDTDPFRTSAKDHDRGYTGHEQFDDSGLIHMNGRIYDPELGRFLSPDPIVQIPEYSQNFNRYSYVLNNPLNATDPSGFSFISKAFSKIGSFIVSVLRSASGRKCRRFMTYEVYDYAVFLRRGWLRLFA